jgi:hypothetical protein
MGFLVEAGEHHQAGFGVIRKPEKPTAFAAPITVRSIVRRFQEITGLGVFIPDNGRNGAQRASGSPTKSCEICPLWPRCHALIRGGGDKGRC